MVLDQLDCCPLYIAACNRLLEMNQDVLVESTCPLRVPLEELLNRRQAKQFIRHLVLYHGLRCGGNYPILLAMALIVLS